MQLTLTRRSENADSWTLPVGSLLPTDVGLREGDCCALQLEIDPSELATLGCRGDEVRLLLSGAGLTPCRYEESRGVLRVTWEWGIDFYAGEIALELVAGKHVLQSSLLDVRPHAGKLGREAFEELLADLQIRAENVIFGTSAARGPVAEADVRAPGIARLAMLQARLSELERSFAAVAVAPHRRLIAEREDRPLDRTRRIDLRAFRGIVRSPAALAAIGFASTVEGRVFDRPRVDHPRREHTFSTGPNRHIAALLRRLQCCCRDLQTGFGELAEHEDQPARRDRALTFASEAATLGRRLLRLSRADFLAEVEASLGDTAAMIAVAKDPVYSRFDRLARRVLEPRLVPGRSLCEKLWLRRTYELYEYWCFFRVAECLARVWTDVRWRGNVAAAGGGLCLDLPDGCHLDAEVGSLRIRLTFQRTFPAYQPSFDDGFHPYSISGQRRPDMVLSVQTGSQTAMIILDAKYRCGRGPIHDALGDMHIYRDSLRVSGWEEKIRAALILTPAHDFGADVYFSEQYCNRYQVGGFDLSPGDDGQAERLGRHLKLLLSTG
ncbi:MAG: DUF2357 domain-containing protein [Planctomycetota bacterium]|nr:DUF2357 domain-containing protein [Planctomycetota bacterium]